MFINQTFFFTERKWVYIGIKQRNVFWENPQTDFLEKNLLFEKKKTTEALLMSWLFLHSKSSSLEITRECWALPSNSFILYTICAWFHMFVCQGPVYFLSFFTCVCLYVSCVTYRECHVRSPPMYCFCIKRAKAM